MCMWSLAILQFPQIYSRGQHLLAWKLGRWEINKTKKGCVEPEDGAVGQSLSREKSLLVEHSYLILYVKKTFMV